MPPLADFPTGNSLSIGQTGEEGGEGKEELRREERRNEERKGKEEEGMD
jgi:hypothetical protein